MAERTGVYHFGESEGEWDMLIMPYGDRLIIQLRSGQWGKDHSTGKVAWLRYCQTFNAVSLRSNTFVFGQYSGSFVDFGQGKERQKAVLLYSDPIGGRNYGRDSAELGFFNELGTIKDLFGTIADEEYYQLSTTVLPESYFSGRSKQELRIMRNSIYAKYGLIFQRGGEMEKYFKEKPWYHAHRKDVSDCLTEIEKRNLNTLARFEAVNNK